MSLTVTSNVIIVIFEFVIPRSFTFISPDVSTSFPRSFLSSSSLFCYCVAFVGSVEFYPCCVWNTQMEKRRKGTRCCVPGCNSDTARTRNISFHAFPKDEIIRDVWVKRVERKGGEKGPWQPTKYHKICGVHFNVTGKKGYEEKLPRFFPHRTYPFELSESLSANVLDHFSVS